MFKTSSPIALVLLITFFMTQVLSSDSSLDDLRTAAHTAIKSGDWKLAKKSISAFKKLGKRDVSSESKTLTKWLKARKKLLTILEAKTKKKVTAKTTLARLLALGEKVKIKELGNLKEEFDKAIKLIVPQVYVLIDNFDGTVFRTKGDDCKRVSDPCRTKPHAAKWLDTTTNSSSWWAYPRPGQNSDWRKMEALSFFCYAKKPGQAFTITVWETDDFSHEAEIKVTWTGWKQVVLPLRGKRSRFHGGGRNFQGKGTKDWSNITSIGFYKPKGLRINLVIDDIWLEKTPKGRKKKSNR